MVMYKDPTEFRARFKAYKEGKKPYENGLPAYGGGKINLGENPTNATVNSDGTFIDDYTKVWDDLEITPKGPRIKAGHLYKYQEPWDDEKFVNAVTGGGLNNLSPAQWARRIYDLQNGNLTVDSWLNGNAGIIPDKFAKENPGYSAAANMLFDFWTLGGPSLIKNAKNWAQIAQSGRNAVKRNYFTFQTPEQQSQNASIQFDPELLGYKEIKQLGFIPSLPPEGTYVGKLPRQILDLNTIKRNKEVGQILEDTISDPNNYTSHEIKDAVNTVVSLENQYGTLPTIIPSTEKQIELGSNVQEQLKNVINPILSRYGYDPIPGGLDDATTRQMVLDRAKQHRTFIRGVYLPPEGSTEYRQLTKYAMQEFNVPESDVTDEQRLKVALVYNPKTPTIAGKAGLKDALDYYGLSFGKYDARYTSNRDAVAKGYSNPNIAMSSGKYGGAYKVHMPLRYDPNWSLSRIWEENEFPILDVYNKRKSTDWRTYDLPYILKTGKEFPIVDPEKDEVAKHNLDYLKIRTKQMESLIQHLPVPVKMKYSDTKPSLHLWAHYDKEASQYRDLYHVGLPTSIDGAERLITNTTQLFHKYGVKPINPVRTYTLGPRRYEIGDVEVKDPDYTDPQIETLDLKYPRALNDLYYKLDTFDKTFTAIENYYKALNGDNVKNYLDDEMKQFTSWLIKNKLISQKQFDAVRKAFYFGKGDPLKYIDKQQIVQKAKDLYFKDIRLARSKDAFSRKMAIERWYQNNMDNYNKTIQRNEEALSNEAKYLMFKDDNQIRIEKDKLLKEAGVTKNTDKISKDGYRVFTTEGIREPSGSDTEGQHYVVIGNRNSKNLEIGERIHTGVKRKHHGHGGTVFPGISRNLGSGVITVGAASTLKPRKKDEKD